MSRRRIPRDYQLRASLAFDEALKAVSSALIVHPTGTGKTVVMGHITQRWCEQGKNVLLLGHRVELLDQAADKFEGELGYRPQVIQADRQLNHFEFHQRGRAYIGSVQTLCRGKRLEVFRNNPIDLLLIDEAHHAVAKTYRTIRGRLTEFNPRLKVGGVTATPNRSDKKATGIVFDVVADQIEISEAVGNGWLVPPCEKKVIVDGVDFSSIKLTKNEAGEIDFDQRELESRMKEEKPLHAVTGPLLENSGTRKWIVFATGVEHGRRLADILNRARPGCAEAIDGKTHPPGDPNRQRILADFCNPNHPMQFLANFGILTEGTDLPLCAGVCIARPTKSMTVLVQMIGRALRPLDGLVDAFPDAPSRVHAIEQSGKPSALILYFIPKTVNVKVLTVVDALGGNYDDDTRCIASDMTDEQPGANVLDKMRQAAMLADLLREERHRLEAEKAERRRREQMELAKKIMPKVSYRTQDVGGYHTESKSTHGEVRRGGATDEQVKLLVALGIPYETACGYGTKQAGAVIGNLKSVRCTDRMRDILRRYGENPDVPFDTAKRTIKEIELNGWRPLKGTA